jgi:hypothetical protein
MPTQPEYHVPPVRPSGNQSMILLRIIVSSAVLLYALFVVGDIGMSLFSIYTQLVSNSLPLSTIFEYGGFIGFMLFSVAIAFIFLAARTLYHTLRYRSGKASAIPSTSAMRTLTKAIIIVPVIAVVAAILWFLIDLKIWSGWG